jgi:predicted Fe-Mo cluster-binding NifX family protein
MKIAIAHWQDRISPVFDVSDKLCLIHIEDGKEVEREERILASRDPFSRAREVSGLGVDVLICGAVSRVLEMALAGAGVRVAGFICGDLQTVLSAFLCGQLADGRFFMPGCYAERQGRRFHRRQRRCSTHHELKGQ